MFMRYTRKPTEMLRLLSKSKETPRREGEEPAVETMAVPGSDGWGMALRWRPAWALPPWAAGASARAHAAFRCYGLWFQQGDSVRS